MKKSGLALLGVMVVAAVFMSGCSHKKDVRVLQAQVGAITDELVRLDASLQETRAAIVEEENRLNQLKSETNSSQMRLNSLREEEGVIQGIYRTPSGFELPSIKIQQALKNAGYYRGKLDGKIGPETRSSVKAFQKDNGLEADGVVGRQTWNKLKVYLDTIK
ncbi:MAG: peptidoglycan-binding protein [Candidatus Omnitrophica bacterium]|nr:peptidoglycan-binding protein [Candidatus Omnitrophota bacterium]